MSSRGENKHWIYILGGAALVAAAAILIHSLSSGKEDAQALSSLVLEEIDKLGKPQKEMNGMLKFGYYKDVFFVI